MKLWHSWVGGGRFIVRAKSKEEAIELARKSAEDYFPTVEDAQKAHADATAFDSEGPPEVLDVDFS